VSDSAVGSAIGLVSIYAVMNIADRLHNTLRRPRGRRRMVFEEENADRPTDPGIVQRDRTRAF
jgi:hypothetical protein